MSGESARRLYFRPKAAGMQEARAIRAFLQSAEGAAHKAESAELPYLRLGTADVNKRERAGLPRGRRRKGAIDH